MKKKILTTIAFLAVLVFINEFLNMALLDDVYLRDNIARCTDNTYQDMFIGTSQCRASVDPDTVAAITGRTTTNASAALSSPLDQYYFVKLYVESGHKPERIIYECDPYYFSEAKNGGHVEEFPAGMVKLEYFAASAANDWRTVTSPWVFQWSNYFRMGEVLRSKISYFKNGYDRDYHGFAYNNAQAFTVEDDGSDHVFEATSKAADYMQELIDYCKEQGIELVLFMGPVSDEVYLGTEAKYRASATAWFEELAEKNGIEYIDFNTESLPDFKNEISSFIDDEGHMNGEAAELFSRDFAENYLRK